MKRVLTVGEPMGLFIAKEEKPLECVRNYFTSVAGAEFNVSVGLTRLGMKVGYLTKLGTDPFGKSIINQMNDAGIDTSLTRFTSDHTTGFMLKSKNSNGDPDIYYYRKNSAASTISVDDLKDLDIRKWDAIHMTGIFPALSDNCYEVSNHLIKLANENDIPVFFDPNLRSQLWPNKQKMIEYINGLAIKSDFVLPGYEEGKILTNLSNLDDIAKFYLGKGVKNVIIKTGSKGAVGYSEKDKVEVPSFKPDKFVDTVGAGDGFAVGLISGILSNLSIEESLKRANAIGSMQIMNESDNEGLPTENQLQEFIKTRKNE